MLNEGALPSNDGFASQFVPKGFMHNMRVPNFPRASSTYGFLTWLNAKVPDEDKDVAAHCCKPSWGESCHFSYDVRPGLSIIGDDIEAPALPAPEDAQVGVGFLGKYLLVVPSTNTVILTVGQSGFSLGAEHKGDKGNRGHSWCTVQYSVLSRSDATLNSRDSSTVLPYCSMGIIEPLRRHARAGDKLRRRVHADRGVECDGRRLCLRRCSRRPCS